MAEVGLGAGEQAPASGSGTVNPSAGFSGTPTHSGSVCGTHGGSVGPQPTHALSQAFADTAVETETCSQALHPTSKHS